MTTISRRDFLAHSSWAMAASVLAANSLRRSSLWAATDATDPYSEFDGVALAQLVKNGEATPHDLLEATIKRIERLNPKINAVVTRCYDRARARASEGKLEGPFAGVPLLVKDLDDVEGIRTTFGCRAMLGNIATKTGAYIKACEDAGFNILGKTNTPEYGQMATTESLALGPCYNPWDLTRSSGGSSGGAGAAVAAGIVPIATGSDGGGSIRIPASCCGVFGLKVSRGRLKGANSLFSISVKGVLSRTVRDTAHVLAHTERMQSARGIPQVGLVTAPSKRRLKIGLTMKGIQGTEPADDVREAIEATATLCEELGHQVRPMEIKVDGVALADDFLTFWSSIADAAVKRIEEELGRKVTHQDLEPLTLGFAERYANGGKEKKAPAMGRLLAVVKEVKKQMEPYDVVLSPVLGTTPPVIGYQSPTVPFDQLLERMASYVGYTPIFNLTGMPAMSVPLSWNESGLPIGSHFAANLGDEATLLALAYELEAARPWSKKWPAQSIVAGG